MEHAQMLPPPPQLAEGDKSGRPSHLERKEEVILKYASSKSGKKGGTTSKKTAQSNNEKIMVRELVTT